VVLQANPLPAVAPFLVANRHLVEKLEATQERISYKKQLAR